MNAEKHARFSPESSTGRREIQEVGGCVHVLIQGALTFGQLVLSEKLLTTQEAHEALHRDVALGEDARGFSRGLARIDCAQWFEPNVVHRNHTTAVLDQGSQLVQMFQ